MLNATHAEVGYNNTVTRGIRFVPGSATDLTSSDSLIYQLHVSNASGGAVTLLVKDKAGTPRTLIPTLSIPNGGIQQFDWPCGIFMSGGITWSASAADSLEVEIVARYK